MTRASQTDAATDAFVDFVTEVELGLRRALVARYGPLRGRETLADGLAYAWENWARVGAMDNAAGYVYRVAVSRAPRPRPAAFLSGGQPPTIPEIEPRLRWALGQLSERQRVAVLLVHGWGYSLSEAAELLGVSMSTLRNHLERGLRRLRTLLGVSNHV